MSVIASIDQGTSSTRCLLFNIEGAIVGSHQVEHTQYCPKPGYVEHDAMEIWENTSNCVKKSLKSANLTSKDVKGIGITNQRETTIVWNKITGKPYHNAIVWNDSRTASICDRYANESMLGLDRWREKTGLPLATYFSLSKLVYYLENIPELREDVLKGEALFGTVDTWLIWKLTGGKVHVTDVTNASRTLMMNLNTLQWDEEILNILQIKKEMLPKICSSSEIYGYVSASSELGGIDELSSVPISGYYLF
jgi:glycerol kinase